MVFNSKIRYPWISRLDLNSHYLKNRKQSYLREDKWMWQYNRAALTVLMMAFFLFTLVPSTMAAEVPDPTACDQDGATVRKGRPGIASVPVRDGVGPTKELVHDGIYSAAAKSSGKVSKEDKRHLCLALSPIKNPESRYKHKDHSNYYCTLILNRDSQAFCYAVVTGDPKKCDNIVSSELEKECLEKSK